MELVALTDNTSQAARPDMLALPELGLVPSGKLRRATLAFRMKLIPLGPRATVAETSALVGACGEAETLLGQVDFDASETERFGPLGVAMLAAAFAVRQASQRPTGIVPPLSRSASDFLKEVGFERIVRGQAAGAGTLELRQMHALDAVYTQDVADMLVRGVPGITEENSYPIQLCLN